MGRKHAWKFVLGHYLFLIAHSLPQVLLLENCSFLRTDNVHGEISEHIFVPNGDYCLCIPIQFDSIHFSVYTIHDIDMYMYIQVSNYC